VELPETEPQKVTADDVLYHIGTIKKRKAPGPDGIFPDVFRGAADVLAPCLADLYTECLRQGTFPAPWKEGRLVILLKSPSKDPLQPKSYRPINLLNANGKLFEKVIKELLENALAEPLAPEQFGFMQGKCTSDAIFKLGYRVRHNDAKYVAALFVDMSGAFDNLWWPALLTRLGEQRIPQYLYNIIKDYLTQRRVSVSGPEGIYWKDVTQGCPQGSVLGPFLWNLVMDTCIKLIKPHVYDVLAYADDLLIIWQASSRKGIEETGRTVSTLLDKWCEENKMTVAPAKSAVMVFARPGRPGLQRHPIVKIAGKTVSVVKETVYLGVTLDNQLYFRTHIIRQSQKARRAIDKVARLAMREFSLDTRGRRTL